MSYQDTKSLTVEATAVGNFCAAVGNSGNQSSSMPTNTMIVSIQVRFHILGGINVAMSIDNIFRFDSSAYSKSNFTAYSNISDRSDFRQK